MLLEASEHITAILRAPQISDLVNAKLFWELAEEETTFPFITYSVSSDGVVTKDGFSGYSVQIRVFAEGLNTASTIGKEVDSYLKDNKIPWRNRGARTGYNDPPRQEAYLEITYNFKI